jgi:gamma-glutamylputrescine oxidase
MVMKLYDFDVAIIGAGFMGLSCALHASRGGLKVVLIEKEICGSGQSSKCGGQVLVGFELGSNELVDKFGIEIATKLYHFTQNAREYLRVEIFNKNIISGNGGLVIALNQDQEKELLQELEVLKRIGTNSTFINSHNIIGYINSPIAHSAIYDPDTFHIEPDLLISYLKSSILSNNVKLLEHTKVNKIIGNNIYCGSKGIISAKKIVVSAGLGSDKILYGNFRASAYPVQTLVGELEKLPNQNILDNYCAYDARNVMSYFRKSNTKFIFGGCDSQFKMNKSRIEKKLLHELKKFFPNFHSNFKKVWQAPIDVTLTKLPHIEIKHDVYSAYGLNGHGITLSFGIGKIIAEHIVSDSEILDFMSKYFKSPKLIRIPFINNVFALIIIFILRTSDNLMLNLNELNSRRST